LDGGLVISDDLVRGVPGALGVADLGLNKIELFPKLQLHFARVFLLIIIYSSMFKA
jgi:hypothetical protein